MIHKFEIVVQIKGEVVESVFLRSSQRSGADTYCFHRLTDFNSSEIYQCQLKFQVVCNSDFLLNNSQVPEHLRRNRLRGSRDIHGKLLVT